MKEFLFPAFVAAALSSGTFRYLYLRAGSVVARVLLILSATVLAVPPILFTSNYLLFLPYASWFIDFHAIPGIEATSGLVGALLGIMFASSRLRPNRLNGPILIVATTAALGLLVAPFSKQLVYGIDHSRLRDEWNEGVCLQTDTDTCLPASAATMVRLLGGNATERSLASASGTNRTGTEIWYLKRALRRSGYDLRLVRYRSVSLAAVPSIVVAHAGDEPHAVVVMGKNHRGALLGDPSFGPRFFTWTQIVTRYHPDGFCILVERRTSHHPRGRGA